MFKKTLIVLTIFLAQTTAQAYVQACLKTMESRADVTRMKHKEIDTLMHDLIRSVDTRNLDGMYDIYQTCSFLKNTDYIDAKKALSWLLGKHNDLATNLKRPKLKNKKLVDSL